ncbi:farnesol dehydrogenase-like [Lucilia cuprina]|uniref:farnesol dehydrogenase-like n=1 Tax=Lucilia cuprina TaxID=7375 RepID=UPI001F05ACC7|nr:farnesol dehydrogenase-like [Lucilia cuprina]
MELWQNKIAVVTGAASGIGAATCKLLLEKGMIVVGLDIRLDKMETQVKTSLAIEQQTNFHYFKCDVRDEANVRDTFAVIINNAGIIRQNALLNPSNSKDIRDTIDTNLMGIVWCTREAFQNMKKRNVDGHITIVNSICGRLVPNIPGQSTNIYPPSKHAVTALVEVLRHELLAQGSRTKITSVSPGACRTGILGDDIPYPSHIPALNPEDVADAIVFGIQTPSHVQIHDLFIRPLGFDY